jgi:hypothetical protein
MPVYAFAQRCKWAARRCWTVFTAEFSFGEFMGGCSCPHRPFHRPVSLSPSRRVVMVLFNQNTADNRFYKSPALSGTGNQRNCDRKIPQALQGQALSSAKSDQLITGPVCSFYNNK